MSALYRALPVTLSMPSWRMGLVPTTSNSWVEITILDAMGLLPPIILLHRGAHLDQLFEFTNNRIVILSRCVQNQTLQLYGEPQSHSAASFV